MSMTEQEARSKCPEGLDGCKDCEHYLDTCDGNDEERESRASLIVKFGRRE